MNESLIKSTKTSVALAVESAGVQVTEAEVFESEKSQIQEIDMKTLALTCLSPAYNSQLEIENAMQLPGVIVVGMWH